jgi:dihydrofolate reductase (trimethoprim resistance protein)
MIIPPPIQTPRGFCFEFGDRVQKKRGSNWHGRVVGFYSTDATREGYAVESEREPGSVQIYPYEALDRIE